MVFCVRDRGLGEMVGAVRFELTTSCTRNKRATRLRYAPNQRGEKLPASAGKCNRHFRFPRCGSTENARRSRAVQHYQAVIFDMDGVIVDSEPRHERAFHEIFHQMGYGQSHGIHFPDYYGTSDRAVWKDFVAKHEPTQSIEELIEWKRSHFLEILRRDEPIFTGLPELVADLAARFPLAVASGSDHVVIDAVLAMRNLRQHFQAVVSVQDVLRPKPHPDVFLRAAELLKIRPEQCCVIEDSVAGVEAARLARMDVLGITNSFPAEKLSRATRVVTTYEEIRNILLP